MCSELSNSFGLAGLHRGGLTDFWDDILEQRLKETQADVWLNLDMYKNQLRDNLIVFRQHSLSAGKWNFVQDVFLLGSMPTHQGVRQNVDALYAAKVDAEGLHPAGS